MPDRLTEADFQAAAAELRVDIPTIKAVASVESAGAGFDAEGRIILRFEGHEFRKRTAHRFDGTNPEVSYPYAVQKSKRHGRDAFNIAFELDAHAALCSTSWGLFQPMGYNYEEAGFENVDTFVDYLKVSEGNQLLSFVEMVQYRHIDDELQRRDWAGFAKNWNGAGYRINRYDEKLAKAWTRFGGR